jgi:hypothetical protein
VVCLSLARIIFPNGGRLLQAQRKPWWSASVLNPRRVIPPSWSGKRRGSRHGVVPGDGAALLRAFCRKGVKLASVVASNQQLAVLFYENAALAWQ